MPLTASPPSPAARLRARRAGNLLTGFVISPAFVGASISLALPASAHGDHGQMTVTRVEPTSPTEIDVEVVLMGENGIGRAEDATVLVTPTGPDDQELPPVDLLRTTGATYAGTVSVPVAGTWKLIIGSAGPSAGATAVVDTTGQAPTSIEVASVAPSRSQTTATPSPSITLSSATATPPPGDSIISSGPIVALAIAALVVGAAVLLVVRARRVPIDPTSSP